MTRADQLAFNLDALPEHKPGDLDMAAHELRRAQERALTEAWRAQRRPAPCACARPLVDDARCVWCGREVEA